LDHPFGFGPAVVSRRPTGTYTFISPKNTRAGIPRPLTDANLGRVTAVPYATYATHDAPHATHDTHAIHDTHATHNDAKAA